MYFFSQKKPFVHSKKKYFLKIKYGVNEIKKQMRRVNNKLKEKLEHQYLNFFKFCFFLVSPIS
jgi:hypothetical protein